MSFLAHLLDLESLARMAAVVLGGQLLLSATRQIGEPPLRLIAGVIVIASAVGLGR